MSLGDKGSTLFFKILHLKEAKDKIECICEDGNTIKLQEDILQAFATYYAKIFTLEDAPVNSYKASFPNLVKRIATDFDITYLTKC